MKGAASIDARTFAADMADETAAAAQSEKKYVQLKRYPEHELD